LPLPWSGSDASDYGSDPLTHIPGERTSASADAGIACQSPATGWPACRPAALLGCRDAKPLALRWPLQRVSKPGATDSDADRRPFPASSPAAHRGNNTGANDGIIAGNAYKFTERNPNLRASRIFKIISGMST
jgi:hypothetical protein